MRKWGLRLFWILISAAVIYGAYGLYAKWWDLGSLGQPARDIKKAVTDKIQSGVEAGVSSTVQKAQTTITDFIKAKTAGVLDSLGSGLISLATNLSSSTPKENQPITDQAGGNVLPFATGSTFSVPPPTTAIIMRIDQSLTIALNAGSSYKVDWGDGEISNDDLLINQTKLLNHAWSQAGDYTVKLEVTKNKTPNIYSYPIRVYAQ